MTESERAQGIYDSFKNLAGTVGKEYDQTVEDGELPPDTDGGFAIPLPQ